jgi:hypothetical protein
MEGKAGELSGKPKGKEDQVIEVSGSDDGNGVNAVVRLHNFGYKG